MPNLMVHIFYSKNRVLSRKSGTFFGSNSIYCYIVILKGATTMRESNDPNADLDDLLFEPDDGGPSQR